jgi:hypothetical protein
MCFCNPLSFSLSLTHFLITLSHLLSHPPSLSLTHFLILSLSHPLSVTLSPSLSVARHMSGYTKVLDGDSDPNMRDYYDEQQV